MHEFVDNSISVYTYEQIMIYANNSELWYEYSRLGGETVQEQIVGVIYEHLSGVAHQWLHEQQRNKVLVFPQLSDGTYDQYKATDLNFAKQAQIATPKTICPLNIECALDFIKNQHKEIVVKPFIGGAYTTILDPKTLKEKLAHWGPLILQERITGQNCRVLYFENQPLKAFIAPPLEEVDWRECDKVIWQPYELSKHLQLKLLRFFKLGKHTMASVDLIVNSNDSYFLEANTTPSWLDLPQKCAKEQTQIVTQFFLQKCAS